MIRIPQRIPPFTFLTRRIAVIRTPRRARRTVIPNNLANALAEGRITQEEYNEYYPYDGLENSYYSVFVETDLNTAGTTSGQPLRSEDAIATYIADMLLLESNPVFNIVYAGDHSKGGTDFYEFRCLR